MPFLRCILPPTPSATAKHETSLMSSSLSVRTAEWVKRVRGPSGQGVVLHLHSSGDVEKGLRSDGFLSFVRIHVRFFSER
ncbi:hypothetical protein GWI33_022710 [Rhynchophorus ferrugineus]|uniref:Uncharacterized protein n=1 Tax=Rhynchophorus ferrugineus TaxID=354439 RepID=A0A834M2R5_RHYFE|nr:hypothetical protein GWI33_022713 [Rhynchophorus ferrugineus]KAF7264663.1 hypothetical protein GWI33_022710 [Rhynchophorus ferrugineus]